MLKITLTFFLLSFFWVNAHADSTPHQAMSCHNIFFFSEAFERFKISIDRMNSSGLLKNSVLVQESPLLYAIRKSDLEDVKNIVEESIADSVSPTFIFNIAIVSALAIEQGEDPKAAVEKYIAKHAGIAFFDEIAVAIALSEDTIARYLFENSNFDYRRTPMGKDLLMTAVYFGNGRMLKYLMEKGVVFVESEREKAIRYAALTHSADVLYYLMRNPGENN